MFRVLIVGGPDRGRVFEVKTGDLLQIGRGSSSDTRLRDPTVSRLHCDVALTPDGQLTMSDRGSSSGTSVNGRRADRSVLFAGDTIELGQTELRIERVELAEQDTQAIPAAPEAQAPVASTPQDAPAAVSSHATVVPELPSDRDLTFLIGEALGEYQIQRDLATGKTGVLFLAKETKRDRDVALKVLWPDLSKDATHRHRFKDAMRSMHGLNHPSLVQVYAAGDSRNARRPDQRLCWCAMEYVPGVSFRDLLARSADQGVMNWRIAQKTAQQVSEALVYVHSRGVVHRNISPDNVLLSQTDSRAKLSDLVVARGLHSSAQRNTARGELVGEVAYMPPERTLGDSPLDKRSDIYSLGATVYSVITGRPPFSANTLGSLVRQIQHEHPAAPRAFQPDIDRGFEDVVMRCLAKRPGDRFRDAGELIAALQPIVAS